MKVQDLMRAFRDADWQSVVMMEQGETPEGDLRESAWDYSALISEKPEYAERKVEHVERKRTGVSEIWLVYLLPVTEAR